MPRLTFVWFLRNRFEKAKGTTSARYKFEAIRDSSGHVLSSSTTTPLQVPVAGVKRGLPVDWYGKQ